MHEQSIVLSVAANGRWQIAIYIQAMTESLGKRSAMSIKELFDEADKIGNKYLSPEEILEQEAKFRAAQEKARSSLKPEDLKLLEELEREAVNNALIGRRQNS